MVGLSGAGVKANPGIPGPSGDCILRVAQPPRVPCCGWVGRAPLCLTSILDTSGWMDEGVAPTPVPVTLLCLT